MKITDALNPKKRRDSAHIDSANSREQRLDRYQTKYLREMVQKYDSYQQRPALKRIFGRSPCSQEDYLAAQQILAERLEVDRRQQ